MKMKAKKHSKEFKDSVIEFHSLGTGCTIISERLNIPSKYYLMNSVKKGS